MNKKSKIVVTGGSGLIGSYLIRYLLQEGYENINGIKRQESNMDLLSEEEQARINWFQADIINVLELEPAFIGAEYVFHCAGLVSFQPKDRKELFLTNQHGTANIVNLCLYHGIKKLVYTSSVAAIGRPIKTNIVTEETDWELHNKLTKYAISKHLGEMEVWRGNAEGLNTVILNPSTVLGSGFWNSGPQQLFQLISDAFKYYPSGKTGYVDVRDVAQLHIQAMLSDITNQRFIICGENLYFKEVMDHIAHHLEANLPSKKIKKRLQNIIWRVEKLKAKFTKKTPLLTRETVIMTNQIYHYQNSKSVDTFHFNYRSIENTIEEMAAQFKAAKNNDVRYSRLPI